MQCTHTFMDGGLNINNSLGIHKYLSEGDVSEHCCQSKGPNLSSLWIGDIIMHDSLLY